MPTLPIKALGRIVRAKLAEMCERLSPARSEAKAIYSITSSARASTVAGTSIANDLAVLRLTRR